MEIKFNQNDLIPILCDEPNWESHGLNPNKCLLLTGNYGVGKTYGLERYLSQTQKNPGWRLDPERISMGVSHYGPEYFQRFLSDNMVWNDLGREPQVQLYMGTSFSPGISILMNRYQRFPTLKTHFTTNLTLEQLEEYYGGRIMSRLTQMCNFIIVTGDDDRQR